MINLIIYRFKIHRICKLTVALLCFAWAWSNGHAQEVAIKSNLLYDATTTLNLGVEMGLSAKSTLDISANYNP